MIAKETIDRLNGLPIEEVAQRLGIVVRGHKALCPFHNDRHPSLTFDVRRNRFKCFVCEARGGSIDLVMRYLGKDFIEACEWLNGSEQLPYKRVKWEIQKGKKRGLLDWEREAWEKRLAKMRLTDKACEFLFEQRRIHPSVVKWSGLRSDEHHLYIPYYDEKGALLSVQKRYLESDGKEPRFMFPKGCRCYVYGLKILPMVKDGEDLFVAEGVSDCLALLSSGRKAVAIPSATLLNPMDMKSILNSNPRLHIYPDRDEPGERLFLKIREVCQSVERHQLPIGVKDFGEAWACGLIEQRRKA